MPIKRKLGLRDKGKAATMEIKQGIFSNLSRRLNGLGELAANLWWSWHPAARMLFKMLDRQIWKESNRNPVKMLKELPAETLQAAARNPEYLRYYDEVLAQFRHYLEAKEGYFSKHVADPNHYPIVYFSAEYGLHHSLPFYAGGLGFLAGDYVKEYIAKFYTGALKEA
jgi:starch phosphorylase